MYVNCLDFDWTRPCQPYRVHRVLVFWPVRFRRLNCIGGYPWRPNLPSASPTRPHPAWHPAWYPPAPTPHHGHGRTPPVHPPSPKFGCRVWTHPAWMHHIRQKIRKNWPIAPCMLNKALPYHLAPVFLTPDTVEHRLPLCIPYVYTRRTPNSKSTLVAGVIGGIALGGVFVCIAVKIRAAMSMRQIGPSVVEVRGGGSGPC